MQLSVSKKENNQSLYSERQPLTAISQHEQTYCPIQAG